MPRNTEKKSSQLTAGYAKRIKNLLSAESAQTSLLILAVTSCAALSIQPKRIRLEKPEILLLASLFILKKFRAKPKIAPLQKLTAVYLTAVCLNLTSQNSASFTLAGQNINIPAILLPLSLFAFAFILNKNKWTTKNREIEIPLCNWIATLAIILCHALLLYPILNGFYGYGCDYSCKSIVNVSVFLLICLFLWHQLRRYYLIKYFGIIFSILFLTLSITKRLI